MASPIKQFAAWTADTPLRIQSTSGGVFTELARAMFRRGGIVVAAGWTRNPLYVTHKVARNEGDLVEMRGAKYAPSDMSTTWTAVREAIDNKTPCLFVGTPCQTAAMRNVFREHSDVLLLCSIFCHSVPDPIVWKKYVRELESEIGKCLGEVHFRSKDHGGSWRRGMFVAKFLDGKQLIEPLSANVYANAFFSRLSTRSSCLACQFKTGNCGADLMIGDFWGIEESYPELDDGKGVNAVLVYSERGAELLGDTNCVLHEVSYDAVVARNPCLEHSVGCDRAMRAKFFDYCEHYDLKQAYAKALRRPLWKRIGGRVLRLFRQLKGVGER